MHDRSAGLHACGCATIKEKEEEPIEIAPSMMISTWGKPDGKRVKGNLGGSNVMGGRTAFRTCGEILYAILRALRFLDYTERLPSLV